MLPRKKRTESVHPEPVPSLTADAILRRIHPPSHGLYPVVRFVFQGGGKRLRPRLLYLSARLLGDPKPHLAEAATLVETLHNGTLLHDDVMDRARVRRNRPTANRLWGDGVAILAGDFLLASVMDLALRSGDPSIPPLAVETLIELVDGQMLEIRNQGNLSLEERISLQIVKKKTASLFAMACKLGGLLGRAGTDQILALESFGLQLGIAFQLFDDIQDYSATQARTGKEPGRDLAEAKVTLPVLVAFRRADTKDKKEIRRIFSDPRRKKRLGTLTALVEGYGGFAYTREKARESVENAVSALDLFPPCAEKADMEQAAWNILRDNAPPRCARASCPPPQGTTRPPA